MGLSCIKMLVLNVRDSKQDEVAAAAAALDLIKNKQVQAIIGPEASLQADFIIDLGNKSHVPIISFSATSPSLSSIRSPYFIRATQNDSSQVNAISAVIQAFGWKELVLIYVDNQFGEGIIPSLADALEEADTQVSYRSLISPSATDDQILQELYKLMTMQTRVFIVHMLPALGSRLWPKQKSSMQGVLGIKTYIPDTPNLHNFMVRWKMKFQQDNPSILNPTLNIFRYWAYDAARALAMAVEEMGMANSTFHMLKASTSATDLDNIGISQNGHKLLLELATTTFTGLAGNFWLVDGQLESSSFHIVNINGNAARGIGFWTLDDVLPRDLNTNTAQVTGYCIDIFQAVIEKLPYAVAYDLIPFALPNGSSAVVGDTTIIANRSLYVDFTLPYTESGGAMLVPYKDDTSKKAWVFLKPLTWDLWLTTVCFFVFIAVVVWTLEHQINEDFRGPATHQVGTSFWFSFSTVVFAQREKVLSNLARFVVVVWVFVVLILTQSYTASLSSLLVVQNLQPTVTDVDQLLKSGKNVGYQHGSFVYGMLKEMKFDDSRLISYRSPEECDALLSNGSAKGGIAAAFHEVPYLKLILSEYCNKYTMIPAFKTAGFGFVFPKGSPLVPDISRAILNVTEGPQMTEIENAWLTSKTNCQNSNSSVSSDSLGLDSFWGLFLIAGAAAISALLIFMVMFIKRNWQEVTSSSGSLWEKIVELGRRFYQRDTNSHTFRKGRFSDGATLYARIIFSYSIMNIIDPHNVRRFHNY
ncbi:hypothetical protein EUGRSUZ_C01908 [Eucalyptus grandis]|uniref:Uncharacterized protein n=1 Tax=Eucalyptus grandis TaxID=71139 RepID=A0ACC3LG80_EUCGR|nr:hypothetical protein EUGRSUZ_C01908 [Eucalyptus grandis]